MKKLMVRSHTVTMLAARLVAIVMFAALLSAAPFHAALAQPAPDPSFAVLGATTVTNTGATDITGDLGVSPGTAITGFQPAPFNTIMGPGTVTAGDGLVSGTIYASGPVATQAHADAVIAYNALVAQTPGTIYGPIMEIGGSTFTPGVYNFPSSAQITTASGPVTLDFQGDPNAVFIFQIGSTLITGVGSQVIVINNGGQACLGANVYWAVGSSATIFANSQFVGNILAVASITLNAGASVSGSVMALTGAVTMDTNTVSVCGSPLPPPVEISCKEYSDYWNNYWYEYWKDNCENYCKDNCKDYCKNCCKHHWKDCWKHHDKDNCWDGRDCDRDDDRNCGRDCGRDDDNDHDKGKKNEKKDDNNKYKNKGR